MGSLFSSGGKLAPAVFIDFESKGQSGWHHRQRIDTSCVYLMFMAACLRWAVALSVADANLFHPKFASTECQPTDDEKEVADKLDDLLQNCAKMQMIMES